MVIFSRYPTLVLGHALVLAGAMGSAARAGDDPKGVAFFEAKIRPVLVEKCQQCHSSDAKKPKGGLKVDSRAAIRAGGASGPAVVPGDVDASLLFQAISAADGIEPMPPRGKLPASVVADFRQWISMGAPDPREGTPIASTTGRRPAASRDWWSLRPLAYALIPTTRPAHVWLGP